MQTLFRQGAVRSPHCSTCPGVAESVLLSILYAADRAACQLALLVSALLFAAFLALFMVVRPFVLKATSLFIQSVSDIRRL